MKVSDLILANQTWTSSDHLTIWDANGDLIGKDIRVSDILNTFDKDYYVLSFGYSYIYLSPILPRRLEDLLATLNSNIEVVEIYNVPSGDSISILIDNLHPDARCINVEYYRVNVNSLIIVTNDDLHDIL